MAEKTMKEKKEKKDKKDKKEKKEEKSEKSKHKVKKPSKKEKNKSHSGPKAAAIFSLLADETIVDPTLSTLFAAKESPAPPVSAPVPPSNNDAITIASKVEDKGSDDDSEHDATFVTAVEDADVEEESQTNKARKRKRRHDGDEIEDAYMRRLALEEDKAAEIAAAERAAKRQRADGAAEPTDHTAGDVDDDDKSSVDSNDADEPDATGSDGMDEDVDGPFSPPPRHETQQAAETEVSKANRTVFLGNVSTAAITSKVSRKALMSHLRSFFDHVTPPKDGEGKHSIESLRFRSTAYASAVPKKAAYAKKELMDATTKSTNAYVVYTSPLLAREASKRLNGTTVLDRHLRVDEVAHPAKVDHKRCVFVGNLGFVDDESNIQKANEEEGREKRKPAKEAADVEEGLWRAFAKCGTVESVRVVRDSTTRVGKGIAYVQFEDANAVEAALLYEGKKLPPMLPRKLRVARAKAQKRNAKPRADGPPSKPSANGYQRKITSEEASTLGRAGKLFGRAAASQMRQPERARPSDPKLPNGIRKPEAFVFEGHRASNKGGKAGLKLGGKGKRRAGKPTNRSAKRGAAFKAGGKQK